MSTHLATGYGFQNTNFSLIPSKSIRHLFTNVRRFKNCFGFEIDALKRLKHRKLRSSSPPVDDFSVVPESRRTIYSIASLTGKTVDYLYSCTDIEYSHQKRWKERGEFQTAVYLIMKTMLVSRQFTLMICLCS